MCEWGLARGFLLFGCIWGGLSDLPFSEESLWRISTLLLLLQVGRFKPSTESQQPTANQWITSAGGDSSSREPIGSATSVVPIVLLQVMLEEANRKLNLNPLPARAKR
jgi:hypothetical protein